MISFISPFYSFDKTCRSNFIVFYHFIQLQGFARHLMIMNSQISKYSKLFDRNWYLNHSPQNSRFVVGNEMEIGDGFVTRHIGYFYSHVVRVWGSVIGVFGEGLWGFI